MSDLEQLKLAIQQSSDLSRDGKDEEALSLLDESLARAVRENRTMWIRVLSQHAAVIADSIGDLQRVRRYHEQSLVSNPDSPIILYGLAMVLRRQGDTELAVRYAAKSYRAVESSTSEADIALRDLIVESWPEFKRSQSQ